VAVAYVRCSYIVIPYASPLLFSPLSLHDALPISPVENQFAEVVAHADRAEHHLPAVLLAHERLDASGEQDVEGGGAQHGRRGRRSEEHTSELQSLRQLVCRLLLDKKKKKHTTRRA